MPNYDYFDPFLSLLIHGEKVQWTGQPETSALFTGWDAFLVPFSLMWGGFAVFWETMAINSDAPFFFKLWGIPFVIVGLYFIFGRFIYKQAKKRVTFYAVTDKRLLILDKYLGKNNLKEMYINLIPSIAKSVGRNGVGTITFESGSSWTRMYANTGMDFIGAASGISFYDIKDVDHVYNLIVNLKNK